jgi:TolA-binding protein
VIAARACWESGDLASAAQLLTDNLEHEALTPRSAEWRDSLYTLGQIHYQEGLSLEAASRSQLNATQDSEAHRQALKALERSHAAFQQAISRLSEAVERDRLGGRDPSSPETIEAGYLIADAHRNSAKLPLRRLSSVTIETTRNQLNSEIQRELTAAETRYRHLQQQLDARQDNGPLSPREQQILRNCYFARADVLYDLEDFEEAIQAYATATNRYQHEPEALEAYVQIASCQRLLNRKAEARGTLEQAKVVLQRIPADADFASTTRYSRDEWQVLLDWLITL